MGNLNEQSWRHSHTFFHLLSVHTLQLNRVNTNQSCSDLLNVNVLHSADKLQRIHSLALAYGFSYNHTAHTHYIGWFYYQHSKTRLRKASASDDVPVPFQSLPNYSLPGIISLCLEQISILIKKKNASRSDERKRGLRFFGGQAEL